MILEVFCSVFDILLWILFFNGILKNKRQINTFILYGSYIAGEIALFALSIYFDTTFSDFRLVTTTIISLLVSFAISMLYDCNMKHRIFASVNYQIYCILSEILVYLLINYLPQPIAHSFLSNQIYGAICSKIVALMLCTLTILLYNKGNTKSNIQYSLLILIMPVISIIILVTIPIRQDLSPLQNKLSLIGMGGLLLANIVNYYLLENILRVQELHQKEESLTKQINLQIEKYHQISEAYRSSRSFAHEVKKQYFYINECISKGDTSRLSDFINQSIHELDASVSKINTGNLVIDSFVSNHMTIAEKENITFETKLHIVLSKISIPDYDLCVILGNLLDNSYQASSIIPTKYERHIIVEIFTSSLELVIHVSNVISPDNIREDSDNLYHGYGTTNIERITKSHLGTYTHYIENGWYHAIVSIPAKIIR